MQQCLKAVRNTNLHTKIQRSGSILVSKVFGASREQDLCCVSLAMARE